LLKFEITSKHRKIIKKKGAWAVFKLFGGIISEQTPYRSFHLRLKFSRRWIQEVKCLEKIAKPFHVSGTTN